ncbi:MAG: C-GCAxxG-C-C family protein [Clostridiaceae bacterium]|jgi:C_GCAxxG_C_C family probable redox protein|nr:C-GCAxxG-C-C family protein [Clostridiaceae bacterium]
MGDLVEKAKHYHMNGFSCSESIIKAAIDEGLCDKTLLSCASSFSGGMASGCVCGAIVGIQMVIGYNFGKENEKGNENTAIIKAQEAVQKFKEKNKVTCCKILSHGLQGMERKMNCQKMIGDAAEILEEIMKVRV